MRQLPLVRRSVVPFAASLVLLLGSGGAVFGDDVHLVNGSIFEGVVAQVSDQHVIVELPFGRMKLPRNQVTRVVDGESPLETFRERRSELLEDASSPVEKWLDLARWARTNGLERQATETALLVARLAPELEGLASILRGAGYELDAEVGWIPYAQVMRRRGLVEYQGEWMEPVERRELLALRREELALERRSAEQLGSTPEPGSLRSGATSQNDVALEAIRLARDVVDDSRAPQRDRGTYLGSGAFFAAGLPIVVPRLPLSGSFAQTIETAEANPGRSSLQQDWDILATRQPGSIIPMKNFRRQVRLRH